MSTNVAFAVISGLSLGLLLLPAPWHLKARNTGTLVFIFWAFIGNLIYLTNAIVWRNNIRNPAPVWCDISGKLIIGLNVALPCASLCIQRRLYIITRVAQVGTTHKQRRRDIYVDLAIGLGFPSLAMALHYIVQPNRYAIIENYGCWPLVYSSVPAYILIMPWPWVISLISMGYSVLTIRAFLMRRSSFNELLKTQGNGLNFNRYMRLMALASIEVLFVFPMAMTLFVHNLLKSPVQPWHSWEYVHADWYRITYITQFGLNFDKLFAILMEVIRWSMPFSAILFFVFFGLASEARKQYHAWWFAIRKSLGFTPRPFSFHDKKDTPLTATTLRTKRASNDRKDASSSFCSPMDKKGRPDTFAWLEEGLPYEGLRLSMPQSPETAYSSKGREHGHTPNTPSTSTSYASTDTASTIGRHASISTARSGKTACFSQDDDATICGVPTSLKRSDSIDKPLPEIPFADFAAFRQSQISARQSAAESDVDPQLQIVVSSPTATEFDREDDEHVDAEQSTPTTTPARIPTPTLDPRPALTSLAPPVDSRPLSVAHSLVSQDGGETVFFTPSPGRLSLLPVEHEATPSGARAVYINEEGQRVSCIDPSEAAPTL